MSIDLERATPPCRNLPDIWGEGALFAFSGMDGESNAASGFVATFGRKPYGLLIHTSNRRIFNIGAPAGGTVRVATGDVLMVDSSAGPLSMAFRAWHTLVGLAPEGSKLGLSLEDGAEAAWEGDLALSIDPQHGDAIALASQERRFSLAYGRTARQAAARARLGLTCDVDATIDERLAIYGRLPSLADPRLDRLLKKCFSVMKVNSLSPEGAIKSNWSTPDRVPHRDMWLWDSVFHSIGLNHVDPSRSWDYLRAVLDTQLADGRIPHQTSVTGRQSRITQPPILAWGVWENFRSLGDKQALAYALPRLEGYLGWDMENRDENENGLLEWLREGDERCRSGESGLDNSPRFDAGAPADDVDFSAFAAADMRCISRIARELGQCDRAREWAQRAARTAGAIREQLWDDQGGFYFDRLLDGSLSRVRAISGFVPLLLADTPPQHVDALVQAMREPSDFGAPFPIPTVSLSDPSWSTDMWRGATWANMDYAVYRGLLRHGRRDEARWLRDCVIHYVNKYYERYGVLFEFFDASDERPPTECDRKGTRREPYDIRRKMDSIRDYHWTAAVTFDLLLRCG